MSKQEVLRKELRERILNGYYSPGTPIIERAVAEEMGTSRIPVRAALLQLEQNGLVTLISNRGANVRVFTPSDLQHLFEARVAIEGMTVRLSALRMDPDELKPIDNEYRKIVAENGTVDPKSMASLGSHFHDLIASGCGNPVISRMMMSISDQVRFARMLYFPNVSKDQLLGFANQHIQIIVAIRERNPDLAERLMREHIVEAYELFRISPDGLGLKIDHEVKRYMI